MGICLLLWKHQKPKTEAFSKDFLEEVDKLLTERNSVSDCLFVFFFFFPETGTQDLLLLSSRNGVVHKIYMIGG